MQYRRDYRVEFPGSSCCLILKHWFCFATGVSAWTTEAIACTVQWFDGRLDHLPFYAPDHQLYLSGAIVRRSGAVDSWSYLRSEDSASVKTLSVAGGVYHERCTWPEWDQIYGSAGRAAAAVADQVSKVRLFSYIRPDTQVHFLPYASAYGIEVIASDAPQTISFEYIHSLSTPIVRPAYALIQRLSELSVEDDVVLRFGMLESSVRVKASRCVYDPQSAYSPEDFYENGSEVDSLAVVANAAEIRALSGLESPIEGARKLIARGGTAVVVVKDGPEGAWIVNADSSVRIPAFQTANVWTIGTGDVFAGVFAAQWGVHEKDAVEAANIASRAVAAYVDQMALPVPKVETLLGTPIREVAVKRGKVYLAAPFFCMGQRWIVDESRRCLSDFGMQVFSPVHDVGRGPADIVAPADLKALDEADLVLAILDGMDPGTVFEVGYAMARGTPVYAVAQAVADEDLKMFAGSGVRIFSDFVTAIHHTAWRA